MIDNWYYDMMPLHPSIIVILLALVFVASGLVVRRARPALFERIQPYNYILLAIIFGYLAVTASEPPFFTWAGSVVFLVMGIQGLVKAQTEKTTGESPRQ